MQINEQEMQKGLSGVHAVHSREQQASVECNPCGNFTFNIKKKDGLVFFNFTLCLINNGADGEKGVGGMLLMGMHATCVILCGNIASFNECKFNG